jgi:hypothetical protein
VLLRDERGIYGISAERDYGGGLALILRRDRLAEARDPHLTAVLQPITGGRRRTGPFFRSLEEAFRSEIHHELLRRKGLCWPPPQERGVKWWSTDPKQQARNRQLFHGLRIKSLAIVNALIRQALAEAADPDALRLARRFSFGLRYPLYRAATLSQRAGQLAEVFPALAVMLFCAHSTDTAAQRRRQEAIALVEAGAPLRRVAAAANFPMALRRVRPRTARWALAAGEICTQYPALFHAYLPDSHTRAKTWLRAVLGSADIGPDYGEWTAKHCFEISNEPDALFSTLEDIADWVKACYRSTVPPHVRRALLGRNHPDSIDHGGDQFVTRRFSPDMSLRTVLKLSGEWHEAVANNMTGPDGAFPPPWFEAGQLGGYNIIPIVSAGELYREGHAMRHCAGNYAADVHRGQLYLYSIREQGSRVATLALAFTHDRRVAISQLRGPCNASVPKPLERAVRTWLRGQTPRLPPLPAPKNGGPFPDEFDVPF